MRSLSGYFIILLIFLTGCLETPTGQLPNIKKAEILKEAERQKKISYATYIKQMSLVKNIGFKINNSNADICKKVGFSSGITYANNHSLGIKISKYFPTELNIDDQISIIHIANNSSAEKAGLKVGDKIVTIDNYEFPKGKKAVQKVLKYFEKKESNKTQEIQIQRNGEIKSLSFEKDKICDYPIILTQDNIVNAFADGERILMTQGIVNYSKDENEIALIIAHELAHNDRGHLEAKKKNMLVLGSVGFILDLMTIYYSGGTAGGNAENTDLWTQIGAQAYSVEFEKDADYGGVYYAERAGYDISNAHKFWERIGSENPKQIAISSTHPATAERYIQIKKTVEEINDKKAKGLALVPNEKEKPKIKKKEKKKIKFKNIFKKKEN